MLKDINQKSIFGEKVIKAHEEHIDNETIQVFVTLDKNQQYYNIYNINEKYKINSMNSLHVQEPVDMVQDIDEHFDTAFMIKQIMEYIIWDRFYKYGIAEIDLSIKFNSHEG